MKNTDIYTVKYIYVKFMFSLWTGIAQEQTQPTFVLIPVGQCTFPAKVNIKSKRDHCPDV